MGGKHGMEDGAGLFIYGVSGLLEKVEEGDTENIFASWRLKLKPAATRSSRQNGWMLGNI